MRTSMTRTCERTMTSRRKLLLKSLVLVPLFAVLVQGYNNHNAPLDRRAMAGIWKLIPQPAYPLKEFTVYPKNRRSKQRSTLPELLLMLKEDGSFQQYADEKDEEEKVDIDQSWKQFQTKQQQEPSKAPASFLPSALAKGTWDFRDGNLILAADRPEYNPYHKKADGYEQQTMSSSQSPSSTNIPKPITTTASDTLLRGRVVAKSQNIPEVASSSSASSPRKDAAIDAGSRPDASKTAPASAQLGDRDDAPSTHLLTVPQGSIHLGKFFYPKQHPSFFEQPMFRPIQQGTFSLRQVLGGWRPTDVTKPEESGIATFERSDFYNTTFVLTSQALTPKKTKRQLEQEARSKVPKTPDPPPSVRVMEVTFHANNTFSSRRGAAAILRGKFDVIRQNQLWFQVVRFGFGRSVSGSVYSEGRWLSHEDALAYWGTITRTNSTDRGGSGTDAGAVINSNADDPVTDTEDGDSLILSVQGSVLAGWGLEPLPVARFWMRELVQQDEEDYDEEDDDEDDEESSIAATFDASSTDADGVDWSSDDEGTFQ